jgi:hypothetical protein
MIELIETGSTKAIGIRISGKIEKADMEKMIKQAEVKFAQNEKLGIYVELESFEGISFEALIQDLKFALPNIKRFHKKAVVSRREWLGKIAEISDRVLPGIEIRHFPLAQKEDAMEWVKA